MIGARVEGIAVVLGLAWLLAAIPARAGDHHEPAPVPPTLELEILDPGADPLGNPAVEVVPHADGSSRVVIPPTVIVHRYYYTGDRTFQAPILRGGPVIAVLPHPGTGEQLYLNLNLPPGAPEITYGRHEIVYDYDSQAVRIEFGLHGRPKVTYRQGKPSPRIAGEALGATARASGRLLKRTRLPEYGHQAGAFAAGTVVAAADTIGTVTKAAAAPVVGILQSTPIASAASRTAEQRAGRLRDTLVERTAAQNARAEATIRTVR
jgi:hypothetical protein